MNKRIQWSNFINYFVDRPKTTSVCIFICLYTIFSILAYQQYQINEENKHALMNRTLKDIEEELKGRHK